MSEVVRTLRELNIALIHAPDRNVEELRMQLTRIGCQHTVFWPPPRQLPEKYEVVFVDLPERGAEELLPSLTRGRSTPPTIIAIVGYENPSVLAQVEALGAHGIIAKPLRPIGVMSAIVMARGYWHDKNKLQSENDKLRQKLEQVQTISDAKLILMRRHRIDDREAYAIIRKQAMSRRTTTADIAKAILNAERVLGDLGPAQVTGDE